MLVHPQFDPVAIYLGPLAVRWYGLMYLLGFAQFILLGRYRIKRHPERAFTNSMLDDMLFFGVLGVILGGRLGYVIFYQPSYFLAHPLEIFAVWQGGMSFHGGFLGVITAMALIARKYKLRWLAVTDFIAPLVPLGLGAGRLGNFINAELWGRPTDVPWAFVFPGAGPLPRGLPAVSSPRPENCTAMAIMRCSFVLRTYLRHSAYAVAAPRGPMRKSCRDRRSRHPRHDRGLSGAAALFGTWPPGRA